MPVAASCAGTTSPVPAAGDHARAEIGPADQPARSTRSRAPQHGDHQSVAVAIERDVGDAGVARATRTTRGSPITAIPPANTGASTR